MVDQQPEETKEKTALDRLRAAVEAGWRISQGKQDDLFIVSASRSPHAETFISATDPDFETALAKLLARIEPEDK